MALTELENELQKFENWRGELAENRDCNIAVIQSVLQGMIELVIQRIETEIAEERGG